MVLWGWAWKDGRIYKGEEGKARPGQADGFGVEKRSDDTTRGHVGTRPFGTEMNKQKREGEREREREREREIERGAQQGIVTPCVYRDVQRARKSQFSLVLISLCHSVSIHLFCNTAAAKVVRLIRS